MIYQIGSKGTDVEEIQRALKNNDVRNFYPYRLDGDFGPQTRRSVMQFQKENNLNADGIVGTLTWDALLPKCEPKLPRVRVPEDRGEIRDIFGDPLVVGYWKAYGGFCATPVQLNHCFTYKWEGKNGFWCNKLLIPYFQRVYQWIVNQGAQKHLQTFDGCYNLRNIRGGASLSLHSWGIAVDHNARMNRLGTKGDMDSFIITAFESEGFYWGGNFRRKDPMHFEFKKGQL